MDKIWETVRRQATRDSQFSEGSHYNATNQGFSTFNTGTVHYVADESNVRRQLKANSAPAAILTSVSRHTICTPGSQEHTLAEIWQLCLDPSSPDLIWMHGAPGAGKSAIMCTTAMRLDDEGTLLGSFFFFRSEDQRNNPVAFFPTIALQACFSIPQVQSHVAQSIRQNPMFLGHSQPTHLQCLHLLQTPLINLLSAPDANCGWTSTSPRVLVVDALDECEQAAHYDVIRALEQLASTIRAQTSCPIKIVVASRPQFEIRTEFERLHDEGKATVVSLDPADAKISRFYAERFREIRKKYALPEDWPTMDDRKWLIDTFSQYSLTFADLLTRHLAADDPVHRLQTIRQAIDNAHGDEHGEDFWHLDILYTTILQQIPSDMRQSALLILRLRLGAQPGWRDSYTLMLDLLLQLPPGLLSRLSPYLSTLVNFDNNLRPYHTSLSNFLHDPQRSGDLAFDLRETLFSQTVTKGLLKLTSVKQRLPGSVDKEALLSLLLFLEGVIYPKRSALSRPDPENDSSSTGIAELIDAVDVSSFDFWMFSYFARLCEVLRPLYTGSSTGSTAGQSLTRRMKATWQHKATSYAQCCSTDNVAELIIGLLLLCFTPTHRNHLTSSVVAGLIKYIIQSKRSLSEIDRTVGWNLLDALPMLEPGGGSTDPDLFLNAILQYENVAHTSTCLQVVFNTTLKARNVEEIHPLVADFILDGMVGSLGELQLYIVQCWSSTEYTTTRIPTLEHLDTLFCFIQGRDWVQWSLVNAVKSHVQRVLSSRQFSLTPTFASSRKRKLITMHVKLTARAMYLADLG